MTKIITAIRDAAFQPIADALVRHAGIGPFTMSKTLMRATVIVTPAIDVAGCIHTGEAHPWWWILDLIACSLVYAVSLIPEAAAKRPPKPGQAVACALRHERFHVFAAVSFATAPFVAANMFVGETAAVRLQAAAGLLCTIGFMLGTTLWKDLPRQTRAPLPAPMPS